MNQPATKPERPAEGAAILAEIERRHATLASIEVSAAVERARLAVADIAADLGTDIDTLLRASVAVYDAVEHQTRIRRGRETALTRALLDRLARETEKPE